jgi:L-lactate dehydrogenase complex protein LldE
MTERISLFIPCLVDQVCPEVGLAMARVLERLGYEVDYDPRQTCCGQPAFNAGHREEALAVATRFVEVFGGGANDGGRGRDDRAIVCPSGSCAAMARSFFPALFRDHPLRERAVALGRRVHEFSEFLARRGDIERIDGGFRGRVGFHDSCHARRELGIRSEPRAILARLEGCELVEPGGEPVCCGFGGLFSVKFDAIAAAMARGRLDRFAELGAGVLVSNDPGCVLHLRAECRERGIGLRVLHLAELLDEATGGGR